MERTLADEIENNKTFETSSFGTQFCSIVQFANHVRKKKLFFFLVLKVFKTMLDFLQLKT